MIHTDQIGLVFKNGALVRVLTEGKYWLGFGELVETFDKSKIQFETAHNLNVLLQNADLSAHLEVLDVADHEIVLLYREGKFAQVLTTGKYAFWKGLTAFSFVKADMNALEVGADIDRNLLEKGYLNRFVRQHKIESFEKGILFVDGKTARLLEAGCYYFWGNSRNLAVMKTDMRQQVVDLAGQEVLTKDKAQLRINFTVQYKVLDVVKALVDNKDFDRQLYVQTQMILREVVGRQTFDELMDNKDQIVEQVLVAAQVKAQALGVELTGMGVKDIILPGDVRDIMNQVLIAEKRAQANVIMRREETASTRSLLNTAKLMEENAMLFKLKEMEYVEKIAEKINTISVSGGAQIVDQLKTLFVR